MIQPEVLIPCKTYNGTAVKTPVYLSPSYLIAPLMLVDRRLRCYSRVICFIHSYIKVQVSMILFTTCPLTQSMQGYTQQLKRFWLPLSLNLVRATVSLIRPLFTLSNSEAAELFILSNWASISCSRKHLWQRVLPHLTNLIFHVRSSTSTLYTVVDCSADIISFRMKLFVYSNQVV